MKIIITCTCLQTTIIIKLSSVWYSLSLLTFNGPLAFIGSSASNTYCVYIRTQNATSTLQYNVEHIPSWMAKNKLGLHIGTTEIVNFLSFRNKNVKMGNSTTFPTKFYGSSKVVRYYNIYMKPIIQYGLLVYGCMRKGKSKDILLLQKSAANYLLQKPKISVQ